MTQDQFHTWLKDPRSMDSESIPQLREVVKRYPYFTAAHMLLAKNLRDENHIDQLKQLQLAAIMAPDRKVLHDYLNDKKKPQSKPVEKAEIVEEEPVAAEEEIQSDTEGQPTIVEKEETVEEVAGPRFPDELIPEPVIYQIETAVPMDVGMSELPPKGEGQSEPEELSFSEWLAFTESGKLEQEQTTPRPRPAADNKVEKRSTIELIDHFLAQADDLPKKRADFFNPRKAAAKADEGDFTVISETLANIYFQQEKYELAKQAYQSLSLKYPEKSVYFAARLKEIEGKLT